MQWKVLVGVLVVAGIVFAAMRIRRLSDDGTRTSVVGDYKAPTQRADAPAETAPVVQPDAAIAVEPAPAGVPAAAPETAPVEVTAKQLFADYEENEVSADSKYRDRALLITGIIDRVAKEPFTEKPYVQLSVDRFNGVAAYFADESRLGELKKGEKLVARCRGAGFSVMSPRLKDCAIEHLFRWEPAK